MVVCILISIAKMISNNTVGGFQILISIRRSKECGQYVPNAELLIEPKGLRLPQFEVAFTMLIEESKDNSNGDKTN